MKSTLFLFIFFIGNILFAQQGDNRFSQSEKSDNGYEETRGDTASAVGDPSNPPGDDDPEPVPIDDYLPFLVITAVGLIIYVARNKKELLS